MVRTQVQFEEQQYERLRSFAHRHRVSVAETVRRLVDLGFQAAVPDRRKTGSLEPLLAIAGMVKGGPRDLGARHDDYLDQDFDRDARVR